MLVEQVSRNVMGKSGPSSCQGPTRRMGSTFFGLVDMGPLGSSMGLLGLPSLSSYFILFIHEVRKKERDYLILN